MSNNGNHIIGKIDARLKTRRKELHPYYSNQFKDAVINALTRLDDELSRISGNRILKIDTISVEVNLKRDEFHQLDELLEKKILQEIEGIVSSGLQIPAKRDHAHQLSELKGSRKHETLLSEFLLTGRLPWWANDEDFQSAESWLVDLEAEKLRAFLRQLSNQNQQVFERLAVQFSQKTLDNFVEKLLPEKFKSLKPGGFISGILKYVKLKKPSASIQSIRQNIFQITIREQIAETGKDPAAWFKEIMNILEPVLSDDENWHEELKDHIQKSGLISEKWINEFAISRPEKTKRVKSHSEDISTSLIEDDDLEKGQSFVAANAGVILLHPYLPILFKNLGYLEEKKFSSEETQERAICAIHYLATGQSEFPEQELTLAKFICGWPLQKPVNRYLNVSDYEKEECEALLSSVIVHWAALKNTSADGLRNGFLKRNGILKYEEYGWTLYIEKETQDILLDRLPWSFSIVKPAWTDRILTVQWG